ncbi:tRNA dihydrouridine synthase A [Salmonella enterica subsp. enterica]|nr:tRNA dihydrouridine synthase A [Salmonella enterica subsp. enterica]
MSINGGIKSLEEAKEHLRHMDGVMVGREAYQNPGILAAVDREIFGADTIDADPVAVVRAMYPYIERELSQGAYLGISLAICWDCSRASPARDSGVAI